jgi:hypothetical protein
MSWGETLRVLFVATLAAAILAGAFALVMRWLP